MLAQATYKIIDKNTVTFYLPSDGSPAAAADCFSNMITANEHIQNADGKKLPPGGGMIVAFIRGNYLAEFTQSHDFHSDTEFHYTFNSAIDNLLVYDCSKKHTAYTGSISNFIARFGRAPLVGDRLGSTGVKRSPEAT